jgi:hypothetical protein
VSRGSVAWAKRLPGEPDVHQEGDKHNKMSRMIRSVSLLLGAGVVVGLLGLPGCSDSEDFSSQPQAKANKEEVQKAEFEKAKAAAKTKTKSGR